MRLNFVRVFALVLQSQPAVSAEIGDWPRETLGNHRAVVKVNAIGDAVWRIWTWRRRDQDPAAKQILVVDAATGGSVVNVAGININREFGDLLFQPVSGPGEYQIYFMRRFVSSIIRQS